MAGKQPRKKSESASQDQHPDQDLQKALDQAFEILSLPLPEFAQATLGARGLAQAKKIEPQIYGFLDSFNLVSRTVTVEDELCEAKHKHRKVSLVEVFSKAGKPDDNITSLENAIKAFNDGVKSKPENAGQLFQTSMLGEFEFDETDKSKVHRAIHFEAGYDTEESLALEEQQFGKLLELLETELGNGTLSSGPARMLVIKIPRNPDSGSKTPSPA